MPVRSSMRPAQKPTDGPPMEVIATVPESVMRSPQDRPEPYLRLIGQRSCLALSRFVLSGHAYSGNIRIRAPSHPPLPSHLL